MNTYDVVAVADTKRIRASIDVPDKWLSAGQAAIDSFCRGWLKADRKTNGISILATKMIKHTVVTEAEPELPESTLEQPASFAPTEQSTTSTPIVPTAQKANETLSLF